MKKYSTKGYIILGILFVLVSIIAFSVPTLKTTTFWIAYIFTVVAFAAQVGIWKTTFGKEETLKSKFFGFPVISISIVYVIIQVVVFAVFIIMPTFPIWSVLVVCSIIAGVSAICIFSVEVGRDEIERVEAKMQKKLFYIQELQVDVELLANTETDTDIKKELIQLAEKIRFSDPMSNETLMELEDKILIKISELKNTTSKLDAICEINLLLDERNKKCKIQK